MSRCFSLVLHSVHSNSLLPTFILLISFFLTLYAIEDSASFNFSHVLCFATEGNLWGRRISVGLLCFFSCVSLSSRHRRAIQKSRGSKVRRAEGTMESDQGAPASTVGSTGTTTTTTSSSSTTAASSNSTATITTATTTSSIISTSSSNINSSSSSSSSSNTISSSSSSGGGGSTPGRQSVPQISVYSGIPDRQTVQVSFLALIKSLTA